MTINAAVLRLQAVVGAVAGVKSAPDYPPDKPAAYPFAIAYMGGGDFNSLRHSERLDRYVGNITLELHVSAQNMPSRVAEITPMIELIRDAIAADSRLNNTLSAPISSLNVSPLQGFTYAGVETLGYIFTVPVVIHS